MGVAEHWVSGIIRPAGYVPPGGGPRPSSRPSLDNFLSCFDSLIEKLLELATTPPEKGGDGGAIDLWDRKRLKVQGAG